MVANNRLVETPALRPQVQLLLASFPRNFDMTIPSLLEQTAVPLARSGHLAGITVASLGEIPEPALGKIGVTAEAHGLIPKLEFRTWDEDELREEFSNELELTRSRPNPYKKNRRCSIDHAILLLGLLSKSHPVIRESGNPVFFIRGDLIQRQEHNFSSSISNLDGKILLPNWHRWHGYNDRIAMVPPKCLGDYFLRLGQLPAYLDRVKAFHPETFLKESLRGCDVIENLPACYQRTRAGGLVVEEDYDASPTLFSKIRHAHRIRPLVRRRT